MARKQAPFVCSSVIFIVITINLAVSVSGQIYGYRNDSRVAQSMCETGSCIPGTGNLLIGRAHQLHASSTCGLRRPEKFCIVSNLNEREGDEKKNCMLCDSRPYAPNRALSHNISNVIGFTGFHNVDKGPWWQSENGVEEVYIQLDLEAEFHFTHLMIIFKSFFPAVTIIERSSDRGRSWQPYRYFAYDCAKEFPHLRTDPPQSLNDVICEERYASTIPSTAGELIFRVLPSNINITNPFAPEVLDLIKVTNLRINFTKLHTLGDNLLDKREEIQEKYFYAIRHMIVRGSCSCYGHANRCVPLPEDRHQYYPPDMVHGQCECTHNTKGRNCNECEDFYNDLPWQPAFGKSQNACKRCNCNNHATSCHFDWAVYGATGNISGGVCDNCLHNTQGIHCEECLPFFYHDPSYDITDPVACQPCDCDPRGSLDDGICDSHTDLNHNLVSGRCHCKRNVDGRRCDQCKEGYWNYNETNPDGCQPCTCDPNGIIDNQGCNVKNGECTCKRFVIGRDCNQCLSGYWGLSVNDRDGCKPCNCDPGGAYDNECDVITGQCRCRSHVTGRTCDQPEPSYFTGFLDHIVLEAEVSKGSPDVQVVILEPPRDGRENAWTGTGYMRTFEGSSLEFTVDHIQTPLDYDLIIRYSPQLPNGWKEVNIRTIYIDPPNLDGPCVSKPIIDLRRVQLPVSSRSAVVEPPLCLEPGKTYKIILEFVKYDPEQEVVSASVLIDSVVLIPRIEALNILKPSEQEEFEHYRCGELFLTPGGHSQINRVCAKYLQSVGAYVHQGAYRCDCNATGAYSYECESMGGQCQCKPNVVGRQCDRCAPGTYGFGPKGCFPCDCNSWALDNFCDVGTGQCKCRQNTYGRQCDQCQIGFWNFPNCQRCECNGHADSCDPKTGLCTYCRDNTTGPHCETCLEGYYGAPQLGMDIPCRACPCPGTTDVGPSHASRCSLDPLTQDVKCECEIGYAGSRCEVCGDNYYGNPDEPNGICQPCQCNNNIDITRPGNCDPRTGKCLQCLFNTEGDHCEICKERYYGDAINQQCTECVCEILGTNATQEYCNRTTGQCPCLPNVIGISCDKCQDGHWKIASGTGCEPCDCDSGSYSQQCNAFDGQCECRPGFGSRRCDQCQTNHWGDPHKECFPCKCDLQGSATNQCNRNNGTCICREGMGGDRCDKCARGYLGQAPECSFCGDCFKNWDEILDGLSHQAEKLAEFAANIKEVGVLGAYTHEFNIMENSLKDVQSLLNTTSVSENGLKALQSQIGDLKLNAQYAGNQTANTSKLRERAELEAEWVEEEIGELRKQMNNLLKDADQLKDNATRLQEANVEGALNLTRKAQKDSAEAEVMAIDAVDNKLVTSERQCKRALTLYNRSREEIFQARTDNERALNGLLTRLDELEMLIPGLNEKVCGREAVCDESCGGAGCNTCGGISCDTGAVTKANMSADLVNRATQKIREKEGRAEELLRGVTQAKHDAVVALNASQVALKAAESSGAKFIDAVKQGDEFKEKWKIFDMTAGAKPQEIRTLAEETRKLNINLKPEEGRELALKISNAARDLNNTEDILRETNREKERAERIKDAAIEAKKQAEEILDVLQSVTVALEKASEAQSKADKAILQANSDIALAEKDFIQIASVSSDAQKKVNETLGAVQSLNERLKALKSRYFTNNLSSEEIQKEVAALSWDTENKTKNLKKEYDMAVQLLEQRASRSDAAKDRAEQLFNRANKLKVATSNKERDLKELENSHAEKSKQLEDLEKEMAELSEKMKQYVDHIGKRSKYYNECIA